jgi:hypothetical protein
MSDHYCTVNIGECFCCSLSFVHTTFNMKASSAKAKAKATTLLLTVVFVIWIMLHGVIFLSTSNQQLSANYALLDLDAPSAMHTSAMHTSAKQQQQSEQQQSEQQQSEQQQQQQPNQADENSYFATITEWPIPSQVEQSNANQTHWCIIGRHSNSKNARRFFKHFPHAAESLLPCWSWWRRTNAVDHCGIILMDGFNLPIDSWHHQLIVTNLNCKVKIFGEYYKNLNRTHPLGDNAIYHTVSTYWKNPRFGRINYIEKAEDAWALRRRFISDAEIIRIKQNESGVLQIGILQRLRSRTITNLDDIANLLKQDIPDANITMVTDLPASLKEQVTWFATKDIIIGAHGAAMMNCLFILPKTIVMQLYPENYFFQSLEPLIETVGGIALDWYYGTDPVYDWRQNNAVRKDNNNYVREANITAPPNEVVDPILFTMGRKPTPSGWIGGNWSKALVWMV